MHATVSDCILDIALNSIEAGATALVVEVAQMGDSISIIISDNGSGMDEQTLAMVKDPFSTDPDKHPNRRVGLGVSFLVQMVSAVNGTCDIKSELGLGTSIEVSLDTGNVDCPPLGDMYRLVAALVTLDPRCFCRVRRSSGGREYLLDSSELRGALTELESALARSLVIRLVKENEEELVETNSVAMSI